MFEILGKLDLDEMKDEEAQIIMDVVKELKSLRVLTTEVTPLKFYNEAKAKIKTSEYEILLTVRDEEENVQFLIKDEGDVINELLLLVGGEDEFVMLSFVGDIDLNKISQLAKKLDVKGVEHLDKLDEDEDDNDER
jgi:mRNA-degrading endonuclease RelE of RelBE toxin-antitoxin system